MKSLYIFIKNPKALLYSHAAALANIIFYTTDKYENPEGKYQLGLEKEVDEKGKRIARFYYGGEKFSTADIFKELSKRLNEIQEGTQEYDRIRQLLNTRSLDAFKSYFSDKTRENSELLDKLFEILKKRRKQNTYREFKSCWC